MRRNAVPHQIILAKADKIVDVQERVSVNFLRRLLGEDTGDGKEMPAYKGLAEIRQISEQILEDISPKGQRGVSALGEVLACSSEKTMFHRERMGVDGVRWAVLQATGQEADKRGLPIKLDLSVADGEKGPPQARNIALEKDSVRAV
jgi:GTP-binding protein